MSGIDWSDRRDRAGDGSSGGSRPSKNNRQAGVEPLNRPNHAIDPSDMPEGQAFRPLSVEPGRKLRDEAVHERLVTSEGPDGAVWTEPRARQWHQVVSEWRQWYADYQQSHIEFEGPEGQTVRTRLQNSYMPEYGKRYYAKLKDFERGVERYCDDLTTVMLTFTASHLNEHGGWRCPADHMRDIMAGYDAARKQVHQVLEGLTWEYARVWEPHSDGFGHLHMAIFVDSGERELEAADFRPVMESHVANCKPAGWDAHAPEGGGGAVSVNEDVENLGSYISEYIGIFGEEALSRPITEQAFYATCWATNTRRVDFSNGAHEIMDKEQFRRETGLRPEDRGAYNRWKGETSEGEDLQESEGSAWSVDAICQVEGRSPEFYDPTSGGVDVTRIRGAEGVDPVPDRGGPPPG